MMKKLIILISAILLTAGLNAQVITPVPAGGTWSTARGIINANDEIASDSMAILQLQKAPLASPTFTGTVSLPLTWRINGVMITSNGNELNILDGALVSYQELNKLVGIGTDTISTRAYSRSLIPSLSSYAPLASPTFTGVPKISTDTIATRAYARLYGGGEGVNIDTTSLSNRIDLKAPIDNPNFTGVPKLATSDTIATRAYARTYGGTGTVTIDDVQDEIADSLNVLRPKTLVGNGTVGPFFDGTQDGGQILYFYGNNGFYTALQGGAPLANRAYRLPIAALPSAGTTSLLNIDENGNMGFVASTTYAPLSSPNFSGIPLLATSDTLSTRAYSRSVGGGTMTELSVAAMINDSLEARIGVGVELADVAVMLADSLTGYVTPSQLTDSLAGFTGGSGDFVYADTTDLLVTVDRLRDSLAILRYDIEELWSILNSLDLGDITPPAFSSAEIGTYSDSIVVILLSNTDVHQDSVPPASAFSVYEGAEEFGIEAIEINSDTLFIALDSTAVNGETYTLNYTQDFPALQDSTGNKTVNWTDRAITNNVEAESPPASQQNLILHSEDMSTGWTMYAGDFIDIVVNQANDLNGQATLDEMTTGSGEGWFYQTVVSNMSPSTAYVISFEVSSTDTPDATIHVQVENVSPNSTIVDTAYGASITSSPQRLSFEFTTPGTVNSGIRFHIIAQTSGGTSTVINIGRVHVYQGVTGDHSYVTTTTTQYTGD